VATETKGQVLIPMNFVISTSNFEFQVHSTQLTKKDPVAFDLYGFDV